MRVDRKSMAEGQTVAFDPMYGPAVRCKRFSSSWHSAVLHQCIRSLIGAVLLRTIMDISARAFSLVDRPRRAIWVTRFRMRREDRSSISSHPLADLGRYGCGLCQCVLPIRCRTTPADCALASWMRVGSNVRPL